MAACPPQPDCFLFGRHVQIRPLRVADLPEMAAWEPHTDPLLRMYNLQFDSAANWRRWLARRSEQRWLYGIRSLEGVLIGHLSLRQLDPPRSARLGITLAAGHLGRGYGTDAVRIFLDYYFGGLGFEVMRLDVSGANIRARRLYRRLGFRQLGSFWQVASRAEDWSSVEDRQRLRHYRQGQVRYFEMRLRASGWQRIRGSLE